MDGGGDGPSAAPGTLDCAVAHSRIGLRDLNCPLASCSRRRTALVRKLSVTRSTGFVRGADW